MQYPYAINLYHTLRLLPHEIILNVDMLYIYEPSRRSLTMRIENLDGYHLEYVITELRMLPKWFDL